MTGFGQISFPQAHREPIGAIKTSNQLAMPTDANLRDLPNRPEIELRAGDSRFDIASQKGSFLFANDARCAGAKYNGVDGVFLGHNSTGSEIWAHLVPAGADEYLCDALHRALVLLQPANDKRADADVRAVLVTGLLTLGEVAQWDGGIQGSDLVSRFNFIYDALVMEAKGSVG